MDRWQNKTAVVTGASSGIGAAIAIDLVNAGINVVALARRKDRLDELQTKINKTTKAKLYAKQCDVTNEENILEVFKWIDETMGGVHILINNAGIGREMKLIDKNNTKSIREVIDTNLLAAVICTREAFQSMKQRNVNGHIVLINSIAGHSCNNFLGKLPSLNIYPSTKYALTAMTEILRQEFQIMETEIKITSISPGVVKTEIFNNLSDAQQIINTLPHLQPEDISSATLFVLGTPPHVQIHEMIIKPVGEKW